MKKTILIIDDESEQAINLIKILKTDYYFENIDFLFLSPQKNETLDQFIYNYRVDFDKINLLITDYNMFEFTGIDLIKKVMNSQFDIKNIYCYSSENQIQVQTELKYLQIPLIQKGNVQAVIQLIKQQKILE